MKGKGSFLIIIIVLFLHVFFLSKANICFFSQGKSCKYFCHIVNTKDSFFSVYT